MALISINPPTAAPQNHRATQSQGVISAYNTPQPRFQPDFLFNRNCRAANAPSWPGPWALVAMTHQSDSVPSFLTFSHTYIFLNPV
jgi:hypothetical protein